jgi:hypothetical protein
VVLGLAGYALLRADPARAQCRNGAWKVEKKNLTTGAVSPGERLDLFFGSHWAHLGLSGDARIAELRLIEGPGKFRLAHSWHPERVGEIRDRSIGWEETCEGDRMVQTSLQEPMEGGKDRVQYTYTRLPTEPTTSDGVWKVQLENLTRETRLDDPLTAIHFGDYVVWFHQPPGKALTSSLFQLVSQGKWKVLLSTRAADVDRTFDFSMGRRDEHQGSDWTIQWTAADDSELGGLKIKKGDRVSALCSPVEVGTPD